jgi:hypothetical protein
MSDDGVIGDEEEKAEPRKTNVTPEAKKVPLEEPILRSTEYEAGAPRMRMKFDPIKKSYMRRLKEFYRERAAEREAEIKALIEAEREDKRRRRDEILNEGHNNSPDKVKTQFAPQKLSPLEVLKVVSLGSAPPDTRQGPSKIQEQKDHLEAKYESIRLPSNSEDNNDDDKFLTAADLADLEKMLEDDTESFLEDYFKREEEEWRNREEQTRRMEDERAQQLRDQAAAEPRICKKLELLLWDPYQIGGYRHLSVIFAFLSSIYIIGIGVTMAIAPNVRTMVYTCIPLVPEALIKIEGGVMQVRRTFRKIVRSRTNPGDLEATAQGAQKMAQSFPFPRERQFVTTRALSMDD